MFDKSVAWGVREWAIGIIVEDIIGGFRVET